MSARDTFHTAVRRALEKDGWEITDDPLRIQVAEVEMLVDLGAERLIAAEKQGDKIAVEIKTFAKASAISEFHTALGQFLGYQFGLEERDPDRQLYLAIPQEAHRSFFAKRFAQVMVERYQIKLLVYNPAMEEVVLWIN
jgi:XisH protein